MKQTLFSLALAMTVLSSCSSDDIINNPMNEEKTFFSYIQEFARKHSFLFQ